jgi:quercetin dioxygenase-like cupin family protein
MRRDAQPLAGTARVVDADQLRLDGSKTIRFEGESYGSGVSFFRVQFEPGQGVAQHRHPYSETWVVLTGAATFLVGEESQGGLTDQTIVVPPDTWHGFTNNGDVTLSMMCIHASPRIIQEWRP